MGGAEPIWVRTLHLQPVISMVGKQPTGFMQEMKGYLRVRDGEANPTPHPPQIQAENCGVSGSGNLLSLSSQ